MTGYTSTTFSLPLRATYANAFVHEIAVADFNGDGKLDAVFTYFLYPLEDRANPIRLLLGDGKGGFTDGTATVFGATPPSTVHGREIVLGDFNEDGRTDAFLADTGRDSLPFPGAQNQLILSTATGAQNATATLPPFIDYTHSAATADIDGDGDLDIYVGNAGPLAGGPYLLINDGHGVFSFSRTGLPSFILDPYTSFFTEIFVDVDGDGDKDLFLGATRGGAPTLLLNDGHGAFTKSSAALPGGHGDDYAVDIVAADLNGDGRPDLVIDYGDVTRYVQILINTGAGALVDETAARLPASIVGDTWSRRVLTADVNGDGRDDLLLTTGSPTPLYLNDGTGRFVQAPADALPGTMYEQRVLADFNGDGRLDVLSWRGIWDGAEQFRVDLAVPGPVPLPSAIAAAFTAVLRSDPASQANMTLTASLFSLSANAAFAAVVQAAQNTSSVATLAYEFFTGKAPGAAGMDYLVSPTGTNPNNLNSAYYEGFNLENRYINFAVNLGKVGEGAAAFQSAYGSLSFYDAFKKAYGVIFGATPSDAHIHAILDPTLTLNGQSFTRQQYFATYGGDGVDGIGTKAAAVGWLMSEAEKADLGTYAKSNDAFLTDVANGTQSFGVDLIGVYARPEYAYHA